MAPNLAQGFHQGFFREELTTSKNTPTIIDLPLKIFYISITIGPVGVVHDGSINPLPVIPVFSPTKPVVTVSHDGGDECILFIGVDRRN